MNNFTLFIRNLNKNGFDVLTSLGALYLWIIFGFLTSFLSCDLQKLLKSNVLVKHIFGILSFFFLFTVFDLNNKGLASTWKKTILVYILFIMSIKNKIYITLPLLILIVIDQNIRIYISDKQKEDPDFDDTKLKLFREKCLLSFIIIAIIGFIMYGIRQKMEFKDKFSLTKLIFGTNSCNETK